MAVFEKALFISYSHLDNQPVTEGHKGWVTLFQASLQALLDMRLGRKAVIWRDDRLRGGDDFEREIVSQFPKTAILVSVLSPRYLDSEWCTREANEFASLARRAAAAGAESTRVFKVIKAPVDDERPLPEEMTRQLGYPFYTLLDEETPLELDPSLGDDMRQAFIQKLARLAWDLSKQIKALERPTSNDESTPNDDQLVVYLAECSYDRQEDRQTLAGELESRGYLVLPTGNLPREEQGYRQAVSQLVARAQLSVHLIGAGYGAVPDGPSEKSVVVHQNEIAAAKSDHGQLKRIISLPADLSAKLSHQQAFIHELRTSDQAQRGADVLAAGMEALKGAVLTTLEALKRTRENPTSPAPAARSRPIAYVVCTKDDRKATLPLVKALNASGFDVKLPLFAGSAESVSSAHRELLTACDALVLFYAGGDEEWRYAQDSEVRKRLALRERALTCRHLYLAAPNNDDKEFALASEPDVIDGRNGFDDHQLSPILASFPQGALEPRQP
jgi:hypothetical protein